jgi:hypothetical protein
MHSFPWSSTLRLLALGSGTLLTLACLNDPASPPDEAGEVVLRLQSTPTPTEVGTDIAGPPVFVLSNSSGEPVRGRTVTFATDDVGALVEPQSVVTNAQGEARVQRWRVGSRAGLQRLSARVGIAEQTASVVAEAGPIDQLRFTSDSSVTVAAGDTLRDRIRLRAVDRFDNPVARGAITWRVSRGSPTAGELSVQSDGTAVLPPVVVAATPGQDSVLLTAGGRSRTVRIAVLAGPPATVVLSTIPDDPRVVGTVINPSLVATVTDRLGNRVVGTVVRVRPSAGRVTDTLLTTDALGQVRPGWRARRTPGVDSLRVTAGAATSVSLVTVNAGPPHRLLALSALQQQGIAGDVASQPPRVAVVDSCDNPLPTRPVTMMPVESVHGALVDPPVATDSSGVAAAQAWIFGLLGGTQSIRVTSDTLAPLEFLATVTPLDPPPRIIGTSFDNDLYDIPVSLIGLDIRIGRLVGTDDLITDVAACPDGTWWAVGFSQLFRLNRSTLALQLLGDHNVPNANALACGPDNRLYSGGTESGIVYRFRESDTIADPIVATGPEPFDGDLAFAPDGQLYAAVRSGQGFTRVLRIDVQAQRTVALNGDAAGTGYGGIFGLSFANGRLFGLTDAGFLIAVDLQTGKAVFVRSLGFEATGASRQP